MRTSTAALVVIQLSPNERKNGNVGRSLELNTFVVGGQLRGDGDVDTFVHGWHGRNTTTLSSRTAYHTLVTEHYLLKKYISRTP